MFCVAIWVHLEMRQGWRGGIGDCIQRPQGHKNQFKQWERRDSRHTLGSPANTGQATVSFLPHVDPLDGFHVDPKALVFLSFSTTQTPYT